MLVGMRRLLARLAPVLALTAMLGVVGTAPASAGVAPPKGRSDLPGGGFTGLGTWVDAYDFSREYAEPATPTVTPEHVDVMWQAGVKTIYLQAAKFGDKTPAGRDILSPDLVGAILGRAHYRGMRVVAWYLPSFGDVSADVRRFVAMRDFRDKGGQRFDAIGVDIEWRGDVPNHDTRNARLVDLTKRVRAAIPNIPLSAIVLPPVVTDVINQQYWPRFPWTTLRPYYDVWQPMSYYTNRKAGTQWRSAYTYTYENIRLTRKHLNQPYAPVSVAGGIGDKSTETDYREFIRGSKAQHAIGASIYDWRTTASSAYPTLRTAPTRW